MDNRTTSFTISFDFKILTKSEKDSNNNSDILLFTLQYLILIFDIY